MGIWRKKWSLRKKFKDSRQAPLDPRDFGSRWHYPSIHWLPSQAWLHLLIHGSWTWSWTRRPAAGPPPRVTDVKPGRIWVFPTKNKGGFYPPKSSHLFIGFGFPLFSPSILGVKSPYFWKHPYGASPQPENEGHHHTIEVNH